MKQYILLLGLSGNFWLVSFKIPQVFRVSSFFFGA